MHKYALEKMDDLMQKYKNQSRDSLRKTRLVEDDKKIFAVEIILYGGKKVGMIAFEEQTAVITESKKIFKTLETIFEMQWKNLK